VTLQIGARQIVAGAEAQVDVELMRQAQRQVRAVVGDLLQLPTRSAMLARSDRGTSLRRISSSITVSRLTGWR
jgi:hypothetical protein